MLPISPPNHPRIDSSGRNWRATCFQVPPDIQPLPRMPISLELLSDQVSDWICGRIPVATRASNQTHLMSTIWTTTKMKSNTNEYAFSSCSCMWLMRVPQPCTMKLGRTRDCIIETAATVRKQSSKVLKQLINPLSFDERSTASPWRVAAVVTRGLPGRRQDSLREAEAHATKHDGKAGRN